MHFSITNLLAIASLGVLAVEGKGINCEGSSNCGNVAFHISKLINDVKNIDPNRWYYNGNRIACWQNVAGSGFCAFPQKTGGVPGKSIPDLLQKISDHGCKRCGSVPLFYPQDNNIDSHGEITVNWVSSTGGCNGLC
ncbi:hypothetical protein ETB97_003270 [Aspergillus alliaceus]|uniref:Killer toxin n=1 Tax=Petromyces alliaceus TaxID=209559 RepID=A0A5N7CB67_PETAA|nr:killer toxin [Aspergillus alliaceus]KAB8233944.1 killer toxin [Aspergillus alliaceus]KAE8391097.1 killer toxin [Aspergillus alliaceus]KAF5859129.1 hypothetical protein ETB97_003270 [Aspergillus burnettii]